ncbi:hypothetical protein [Streptomyces sp. SAI-090]|uniref:hypothetical protein n=1 Tax=Streptomyces sp. SAI-090 TaxID=2940545 RepID=UPI002474CF19|nr:hypothetical protein [Streptomyces sp. SAI-090]MDH6522358.1 hypothetical protein [Streptomyces sp. SAI-090]
MTSALELLRPSSVARAQLPRCKAVELRALRESFRRAAKEKVAGPVVTALYVLVRPDQDPAARLALARAAADRAGYAVAEVLVEETGTDDPVLRPRLAYALTAMRQETIHGLVAASRVDVSPFDAPYETVLRRLRSAGGFLHLAHDETRL